MGEFGGKKPEFGGACWGCTPTDRHQKFRCWPMASLLSNEFEEFVGVSAKLVEFSSAPIKANWINVLLLFSLVKRKYTPGLTGPTIPQIRFLIAKALENKGESECNSLGFEFPKLPTIRQGDVGADAKSLKTQTENLVGFVGCFAKGWR